MVRTVSRKQKKPTGIPLKRKKKPKVERVNSAVGLFGKSRVRQNLRGWITKTRSG